MDDDNDDGYQELLCNIEISKINDLFIARMESAVGGPREYKDENFENILNQLVMDLQEDFES